MAGALAFKAQHWVAKASHRNRTYRRTVEQFSIGMEQRSGHLLLRHVETSLWGLSFTGPLKSKQPWQSMIGLHRLVLRILKTFWGRKFILANFGSHPGLIWNGTRWASRYAKEPWNHGEFMPERSSICSKAIVGLSFLQVCFTHNSRKGALGQLFAPSLILFVPLVSPIRRHAKAVPPKILHASTKRKEGEGLPEDHSPLHTYRGSAPLH